MDFTDIARVWAQTPTNRLSQTLEAMRRDGVALLDLITATPDDNGLEFPPDRLAEVIEHAAREVETVHRYTPDPRGQPPAREAIRDFYQRRSVAADPDRIVLTPGTSFAYLAALRILAEPGEEILVPSPGYPLFDDIASICGVGLRRYHLAERDEGWRPDIDEIEFQCTARTRAVMVISPHNPAGAVWREEELRALGDLCARRGLALVFDEVFSEFLAPPLTRLPRPEGFPLTITLNGLSKMFSLPGWKIAWMKIDGEHSPCETALRALEHFSDTFLPVGELAQAMIPGLLATGDPDVSAVVARELTDRRRLALELLSHHAHAPEGGVHLCCRLPDDVDDEEFALRALLEQRVCVHAGHCYDLPSHFVMSCVASPERLREGLRRLSAL